LAIVPTLDHQRRQGAQEPRQAPIRDPGKGARPARGGMNLLGEAERSRHLTRMSTTKLWSSADLDAAIERVTPDVLALLGDGVPRAEAAIVTALAGRHSKDDVTLTLMRLDVLGQLVATGGKYTLPAPEAEPGEGEDA
jgi:hypothetical protein